jgi:hypothetical protein
MLLAKLQKEDKLYLLLAIVLWSYLLARVILVPLVHDEGATFYFYIQTGIFWFYNAHWDANNHVLNSFLTLLSYKAFGDSNLTLRLPNLLSFGVYLYFIWLTAQKFLTGFSKHAFILAMWCCHIYFEHFGYTRGYGISFAMLSAAFYYFIDFAKHTQVKSLVASIIFIVLALSANLTLLPMGTVMIGWLLVLWLSNIGQMKFALRLFGSLIFLCAFMSIAYFAVFSFELKNRGLLYYGGHDGLLPDTLQSVAKGLFGFDSLIGAYMLFALMLLAIFRLPEIFFRSSFRSFVSAPYSIFAGLLLIMLLSIVFMNLLLDVNFPTFRTALYLFPLLAGALAFWPATKYRFHTSMLLPIFTTLFLFQANLTYAKYWKWERITPEMYEKAVAVIPQQEFPPLTGGYHLIGLRWLLFGYHNEVKMGGWNSEKHLSIIPDLQIIYEDNIDDKWKSLYTEVMRDPYSDFPVYIRNSPCPRIQLISNKIPFSEVTINDEYVNLGLINNPSNEAIMAGLEVIISSTNPHLPLSLVMSRHDSLGNNLSYCAVPLHWQYDDLSDVEINTSLYLEKSDQATSHLKVYLWNSSRQPFTIMSGHVKLFELFPLGIPLENQSNSN